MALWMCPEIIRSQKGPMIHDIISLFVPSVHVSWKIKKQIIQSDSDCFVKNNVAPVEKTYRG